MNDFINKYKKVVDYYKLDSAKLNDIACAICIADQAWGTNDKQLDINRLLSSTDLFSGIGNIVKKEQLPKVQVKRLLCDVIILVLSEVGKLESDIALLTPSSAKVAHLMGVEKSYSDYANEDECENTMNSLLSYCVDNSEFEEIFEYIESTFKKMQSYDKFYKATKNCGFTGAYLPKNYDSYGYKISREDITKNVEPNMRATVLECSFLASFVNAFYAYLSNMTADGNKNSVANDLIFTKRLMLMYSKKIQVGISGITGDVPRIGKLGKRYNDAIVNIHNRIFTEDFILSRKTVDGLFAVLDLFIKEGLY